MQIRQDIITFVPKKGMQRIQLCGGCNVTLYLMILWNENTNCYKMPLCQILNTKDFQNPCKFEMLILTNIMGCSIFYLDIDCQQTLIFDVKKRDQSHLKGTVNFLQQGGRRNPLPPSSPCNSKTLALTGLREVLKGFYLFIHLHLFKTASQLC